MSGRIDGGQHDWIGYLQPVGLVVAPVVLTRLGLWPEPQAAADNEAVAAALTRLADGDRFALFRDVLGWPVAQVAGAPDGPALPTALTRSLRDGETLLTPTYAVRAPTGDDFQLLVRIEDAGIVLDRRGTLGGWEATAHQRFERLLRETGVLAGVLIGEVETGRSDSPVEPVLRLVVAPRGEAAGWMSWPLPALTKVSGRGMLAGLKLLLDAHALFTGAPSHRLPVVLAESRAAQAAVSTRLAGQVLASLHELLRGFDAAAPDLIRDLAVRRPHHLYEGLLTVLLRLIFIAYAEDRDLMPSGGGRGATLLYEQGYSLGGLHVRLGDDRALNPDTMDERYGAWGRLLALFRLVERGAGDFMQARGGKLFGEAAFPFLFGRTDPDDPERVLTIGDGCIARVLDGLLTLDGERVSYRALDVEKLGSVYETVMGFTVECAATPMLAIRAGKGNRTPVWVDLAALAAAGGTERVRLLKEWTGRGLFPAAVAKELRRAGGVAGLEAALAAVVDPRAAPRGAAVAAGTPILQPTDERRRTGSHYTPRAMTEPIVGHALAPALARIGADATPGDVLDLKVCDPAVGSGAFLVEACRQLGARLVEAWERWPAQRPTIPADEDDLLHAKRLVAQHCLRGVDCNPLALDLAKLSLWLETLASRHEFTFLDHVLRAGDSLVGLPNPKIMAVTWGKMSGQHTFVEQIVRDGIRAAADLDRLMRHEAEIASYDTQERRHHEATTAKHHAHLVADAVLESFFAGTTHRERERGLAEMQQFALSPRDENWAKLAALRDRLRASPIGITSFHWELEFNDVFARPNPGFDAIVGNPPFAGKNTIASGHPLAYPDWLKTLHPGAHGNADLAAHFFRRAYGLLRQGGAMGLIATNTIRQGDTRETGLRHIVGDGGVIYRAISRARWEGEAAVVVAQVFVSKSGTPPSPSPSILDDRPVRRISAYLVEGDLDGSPARLRANAGKSFAGFEIYGMGFTFDDENAGKGKSTPLAEMQRLISVDRRNTEIIRPYLGGEEVNNSSTQTYHRYTIDFRDYPLSRSNSGRSWNFLSQVEQTDQIRRGIVAFDYPGAVAADWPDLLEIVRLRVLPERQKQDRQRRTDLWWQFGEVAPTLRKSLDAIGDGCCLVTNRGASPHLSFAMVPAGICLAKTLAVFALSTHAAFATLQSRVHEVWARFFASTLEDRLRYTPSDCFETFPLPPGYADAPALEAAGRAYHDHRAALMIARDQGMTPTYNRFHARADDAADIVTLRGLHHAMDDAVLRAYGWDDLADRAAAQFLDEHSEDDHRYQGRLFWPAPFRDALLARLLRLNEERAMAETML
ncbi:Eco57I restriction-modification methylase domain-containing protein [Sphingomonas sp. CFBP 8760]|uniref:Eco57I restriction-modification methylase domain-containing protein n=1 Tax=Sphingomonas sp. CFBP 8760 TaxID=2775282 RepID=UPI001FCE380B|nr:type IIL restriction-modification enzyme MmeI [Sphingomonas sp. CFBP 8760]